MSRRRASQRGQWDPPVPPKAVEPPHPCCLCEEPLPPTLLYSLPSCGCRSCLPCVQPLLMSQFEHKATHHSLDSSSGCLDSLDCPSCDRPVALSLLEDILPGVQQWEAEQRTEEAKRDLQRLPPCPACGMFSLPKDQGAAKDSKGKGPQDSKGKGPADGNGKGPAQGSWAPGSSVPAGSTVPGASSGNSVGAGLSTGIRFWCSECEGDFCGDCSSVPFHPERTCREHLELLSSPGCRFCCQPVPVEVQSRRLRVHPHSRSLSPPLPVLHEEEEEHGEEYDAAYEADFKAHLEAHYGGGYEEYGEEYDEYGEYEEDDGWFRGAAYQIAQAQAWARAQAQAQAHAQAQAQARAQVQAHAQEQGKAEEYLIELEEETAPPVCQAQECQEKAALACAMTHETCGHPCGGVKGERHCLPCLKDGCRETAQASSSSAASSSSSASSSAMGQQQQHQPQALPSAQDPCPICIAEPLGCAPSLLLHCRHAVHAACALSMLRAGCPGPGLSFRFLECPACRCVMKHPHLAQAMTEGLALKAKVSRLVSDQLKLQRIPLRSPAEEAAERERIEQRSMFFQCQRCKEPYYGGDRGCEDADAPGGSGVREQRFCESCSFGWWRGERCSRGHGEQYAQYKCRYCCAPATYFCFGTTHFCDVCHATRQEQVIWPKREELPDCKGGPKCPLKVPSHPPAGEEFLLGCSLCRTGHAVIINSAPSSEAGNRDVAETKFQCYVGGISWRTTNDSLRGAFLHLGAVKAVVIKDRETGGSRGFGFVTFATKDGMEKAIQSMQRQVLDGKTIKVRNARARGQGGGR